MKSEEVMHLHIGAKIKDVETGTLGILIAVDIVDYTLEIQEPIRDNPKDIAWDYKYHPSLPFSNSRLQLRREIDMSDNEKKEWKKLANIRNIEDFDYEYVETPKSIAYKLKIGVDCFGLLDNGEADYNPKIYNNSQQ